MPVKKVSGLFLGLVVRQLWGYGLPSMIGFLCGLLCSRDGDIFASKDKDIHSLLMLVSFTIS